VCEVEVVIRHLKKSHIAPPLLKIGFGISGSGCTGWDLELGGLVSKLPSDEGFG